MIILRESTIFISLVLEPSSQDVSYLPRCCRGPPPLYWTPGPRGSRGQVATAISHGLAHLRPTSGRSCVFPSTAQHLLDHSGVGAHTRCGVGANTRCDVGAHTRQAFRCPCQHGVCGRFRGVGVGWGRVLGVRFRFLRVCVWGGRVKEGGAKVIRGGKRVRGGGGGRGGRQALFPVGLSLCDVCGGGLSLSVMLQPKRASHATAYVED